MNRADRLTAVLDRFAESGQLELARPHTDEVLNQATLDLAFVGVYGIDPVTGVTAHDKRRSDRLDVIVA